MTEEIKDSWDWRSDRQLGLCLHGKAHKKWTNIRISSWIWTRPSDVWEIRIPAPYIAQPQGPSIYPFRRYSVLYWLRAIPTHIPQLSCSHFPSTPPGGPAEPTQAIVLYSILAPSSYTRKDRKSVTSRRIRTAATGHCVLQRLDQKNIGFQSYDHVCFVSYVAIKPSKHSSRIIN
jgi:hypothetical protein